MDDPAAPGGADCLSALGEDPLATVAGFLPDADLHALMQVSQALHGTFAGGRVLQQWFEARCGAEWLSLVASPEIDWAQLFLATRACSGPLPARQPDRLDLGSLLGTVLVGMGDAGALAVAATAVGLRADGNLRPNGFPWPALEFAPEFRGYSYNIQHPPRHFTVPPEFCMTPLGKCVPRTLFAATSARARRTILHCTAGPRELREGTAWSAGLFDPSMFVAGPPGAGLQSAVRRLVPDPEPMVVQLVVVAAPEAYDAALVEALRRALAGCQRLVPVTMVLVPASEPSRARPCLAAARLADTAVVLLEEARLRAFWTSRGRGDPPGGVDPASVSESDGRALYASAAQRRLIHDGAGLEDLPEVWDSHAPELGAAALLAGCLRTKVFANRSGGPGRGVYCAGVSPVLPLPPYGVQRCEAAHGARHRHAVAASDCRTGEGPGTLTGLVGAFLGLLGWTSETTRMLREELPRALGIAERAVSFVLPPPSDMYVLQGTCSTHGAAWFQQVALLMTGSRVAELLARICSVDPARGRALAPPSDGEGLGDPAAAALYAQGARLAALPVDEKVPDTKPNSAARRSAQRPRPKPPAPNSPNPKPKPKTPVPSSAKLPRPKSPAPNSPNPKPKPKTPVPSSAKLPRPKSPAPNSPNPKPKPKPPVPSAAKLPRPLPSHATGAGQPP